MSISPREIYWVLILLSIISSILYVSTKSFVKADVLTEVHTADASTIQGNISEISEDFLKSVDVLKGDRRPEQKDRTLEDKKKHDTVAEIISSFGDTSQVSSKATANTSIKKKILDDVPSVSQVDATENLSETSQGVVFTLADSASVEIQHQVVSASQDSPAVNNATLDGPQSSSLPLTTDEEDAGKVQDPALPENLSLSAENKTLVLPDDQYVVRAEPKIITKELVEKMLPVSEPTVDTVTSEEMVLAMNGSSGDVVETGESSTPPEDIPSFSEWAQKQLAEAEEKQKVSGNINASSSPPSSTRTGGTLKLRSKNYASPDCGAKIVATNPEAASASSVLSPSRDEYLLNTCTSRIWFVVELCEAIQAKKIELANFELFSSSPRDFSVYVSDRVQTRDWRSVGHFTAKDERTIQNFTLHPQLFGKYIKVEFHSHYGSEHFCPVSLFRVYGTSEFEVLESVDEVHEHPLDIDDDEDEDDEDGTLDVDTGEPPRNLFNSAKDAVMSIVKKAAEALGKGGGERNDTKILNATVNEETALEVSHFKLCKSPRHIVVCDNCSDALFSDVYQLLSCEEDGLKLLMNSPFVYNVIRDGQLCAKYGLYFSNRRSGAPYPVKQTDLLLPSKTETSDYISAFFPPQYVAALCNMLAVLEKRVALNISEEPNITSTVTLGIEDKRLGYQEHGFEEVVLLPASTCSLGSAATSPSCNPTVDSNVVEFATSIPTTEPYSSQDKISSLIKPTKTLSKEEENQESFVPSVDISASSLVNPVKPEHVPEKEDTISSVTATGMPGDGNKTQGDASDFSSESTSGSAVVEPKDEPEGTEIGADISVEEQSQDIDTLLKDLKDLDRAVGSSSNIPAVTTSASSSASIPPTNVPPAQQVQKESVFLRLANRIKALERNMSLSGQYLEELSRRYKKQMEEMQRAFNRTLAALGEESRKGHEREEKRMEEMLALQQQLTTLSSAVEVLLAERESWVYKANMIIHHVVLISVELFIFALVLYFCRRTPPAADLNDEQRKFSIGWRNKKYSKTGGMKRRKSVDVLTMREPPKLRHRRPSEEALNIGGTYHELLITETGATEVDGGTTTVPKVEGKRRRRKKKELHLKSASANVVPKPIPLPSNGSEQYPEVLDAWWALSNGVPLEEAAARELNVYNGQPCAELVQQNDNGPLLEQETSRKLSDINLKSVAQDSELRTKRISSESAPAIVQNNGLVRSPAVTSPTTRYVSSPSFMRTAVSSRSSRHSLDTPQAKLKSDNWEWYSSHHNVSSQGVQLPCPSNLNGKMESEQTRRTSTLSSSSDVSQKDNGKKGSTGGLKKMVKKFF